MRNVRSETLPIWTPAIARTASTMRWPCSSSAAATVMSRTVWSLVTRTRSMAPTSPPASPMAAATLANDPDADGISTRIVRL